MPDNNGVLTNEEEQLIGIISQDDVVLTGELNQEEQVLIGNLGVQAIRGESIQYIWNGTQLGIKVESESEFQYVDLKGKSGSSIQDVLVDSDYNILITFDDETTTNAGKFKTYDDTELRQNIQDVKSNVESFSSITNKSIIEILSR